MTDDRDNSGNPSAAGNPDGRGGAVFNSLGDLLVDAQLITADQLTEARAERERNGAFLAKIVVQSNYVTQEALNACFVKKCKIPHISLLDYDVGSDVLALVPEALCLEHGLIPIDKLGRILTIAMVDPLDVTALDAVRTACPELRVKPILCNWTHFEQVMTKYFSGNKSGGSGGSGEMSAASLGLSALPPKPAPPKPAPAPAPAPPASSAAMDTGALVSAIHAGFSGVAELLGKQLGEQRAPAPTENAPFPIERFGEMIQTSMREAVLEALKSADRSPVVPAATATPAPAPAPDWSGLEAAFRSSIEELKGVVRAPAPVSAPPPPVEVPAMAPVPAVPATSGMEEVLQRLSDTLSRAPEQLSGETMAEVIRDSVGGAMQEALATVLVQLRATSKSDQPEAPSLEAIAETMRDTLGGVMQEVLATLVVQTRANSGGDSSAQMEQVVAALREAQTGMVTSIREILTTSQQSQEIQGARLAAIAEAAVESSQQTSQLIEATLVQNERVQNLQHGNRAAHASVSPFGSTPAGEEDPRQAEEDARVRDGLESEVPLESLTFERFFPGEANAFTTKICQAVAAKPGSEYNPLFLYGHVGLGKTHLISAVGNHIQQTNPGQRVGYVSASHFSRRLKEALAADAQMAFRDNYCHWDVLILDDIQFMGGRVEAQEEFFHIFNVLHQRGRQIIIAGDKAPDRLGLLEQRLVSRFASGIVAELKPPEWETRMKILRQHVQQSGVTLPEEICSLVAMRVSDDIRKMVGSLRKITAFAALSNEAISVEMATEILSHIGGEEAA